MQSRVRQRSQGVEKSQSESKQRSSNIELLRIFAMIGIVISHLTFSSPSGPALIAQYNQETFYLVFLQALGQIGVLLFFLITGYFTVKRDFNIKGIGKLASVTWFYSCAAFIFALLIGVLGLGAKFNLDSAHTSLTLQNVLVNLMPIIQNNYWFITTYVVIIFLSPALNKILLSTSQKYVLGIIIGITIGFFGLNYLSRALNLGLMFEIYNNLLLYSLVYCIGAYLQLYPLKIKISFIKATLVVALILWTLWVYRLVYITHASDILNKDIDFPPFLIAMSLFALFLRLKVSYSAFINVVGASTLAVYLIHANRNIWEPLWKFFDVYRFHFTGWFYLFPLVVGAFIFSVCIAIELSRQYASRKLHATLIPRIRARLARS